VAERQLPKLNVAGSIPVSRSNKNRQSTIPGFNPCFIYITMRVSLAG
jgi:hypothetical protein